MQVCARKYEQCGGTEYTGPTCCQGWSSCIEVHILNQFWCLQTLSFPEYVCKWQHCVHSLYLATHLKCTTFIWNFCNASVQSHPKMLVEYNLRTTRTSPHYGVCFRSWGLVLLLRCCTHPFPDEHWGFNILFCLEIKIKLRCWLQPAGEIWCSWYSFTPQFLAFKRNVQVYDRPWTSTFTNLCC